MLRISGTRVWLSWRLAPGIPIEIGSPLRSPMTWIFDPNLPRSVGFGPVKGPLSALWDRLAAGHSECCLPQETVDLENWLKIAAAELEDYP
jgi:hypothetical protein